jgi:hypothetical protein
MIIARERSGGRFLFRPPFTIITQDHQSVYKSMQRFPAAGRYGSGPAACLPARVIIERMGPWLKTRQLPDIIKKSHENQGQRMKPQS